MRSIVLAAALICGFTGIARADHYYATCLLTAKQDTRTASIGTQAAVAGASGNSSNPTMASFAKRVLPAHPTTSKQALHFGVIPLASWGLLQRRGLILLE